MLTFSNSSSFKSVFKKLKLIQFVERFLKSPCSPPIRKSKVPSSTVSPAQCGCPGGYSIYPWVGRCSQAPHTLTLFKTNITDFPTLFKTELRFLIPCLRRVAVTRSCVAFLLCNQWKFNVPGINAKVNGSQY